MVYREGMKDAKVSNNHGWQGYHGWAAEEGKRRASDRSENNTGVELV